MTSASASSIALLNGLTRELDTKPTSGMPKLLFVMPVLSDLPRLLLLLELSPLQLQETLRMAS